MGVPALGYLCRQVVKDNIDDLAYVGDFLYEEVDDLLLLVRRADQLAEIEENSPQIVDHDQAVWEKLVRKDFQVPHKRKEKQYKAIHGEDSTLPVASWRELHREYKEERERLDAQSLQNLEASMARHQARTSVQATLVNPRSIPRLTASTSWRYSTGGSTFSRGFSTRNTNAVQRARREAQEARRQRKVAIASIKPTAAGSAPARRLKIAPRGIRDQVRIQRQPRIVPRAARKPKPPSPEEEERARREARLLAAKNPSAAGQQKVGDSAGKPAEVAHSAPSAPATKKAPAPKPVASTSILFPKGSAASRDQQKVVIKTVTTTSKATSGSRDKTVPGQAATSPSSSSHSASTRPPGDHARGPGAPLARAAEIRGSVPSTIPAKRAAVSNLDGARSPPPPPRPRKKKTEDFVFAKPKR